MMRKSVILLSFVVIFLIFGVSAAAEDRVDGYVSDFEEGLPPEFSGLTSPDKLTEKVSMDSLFDHLITVISRGRADITSFFIKLIGVIALMGLSSLCNGKSADAVKIAVGMISATVIFSTVGPLTLSITEEIAKLGDFFSSVIPIAVGITALGGGVGTATVQGVGMYTALSLVGGAGVKVFSGLSAFSLALSLISPLENEGISSVCRGLKGLFNWVSGIFTALITAAFSLQTLVASAADNASMRAAKYAASGLIPVVGSTVSGAISTLASGLSYARGIVGGGAVAVILYMSLSPLVLLLCYRLAMSLAIILADFMGVSSASKILTNFRFSLDMTVTVYALSTLIYLFEIIIILKTGAAIV